jgi:ribosome-binding factor A
MQPIRRARLEAVILEELSKVVPRELKDPRIASVTFTGCQVTPDGSQATVLVTLLGGHVLADEEENAKARIVNEKRLKDCITGLTSASGFLRRHLATALTVRHIPTIIFKADKGFENTYRVHELLKKISSEPSSSSEGS